MNETAHTAPHRDHRDDDRDHDHDHRHNGRMLGWATLLTLVFMLVESVGGIVANSLALVADAGHMLTDAAALGLAWGAVHLAQRQPDSKRTFGYQRAQVLATFVNGVALLGVVGWIAIEAVRKFLSPSAIDSSMMLVIASIGALVNIIVFAMLRHGDHDDMNIAGAVLHVLGDLLGSVAAIVGAIVIKFTGWLPIDPLLSVLLCTLIVRSAWTLVRHSTHILLEGSPDWLDVAELRAALSDHVPAITDVHHVHCWSLSPRETLITFHANVAADCDHSTVLAQAQRYLSQRYGITHATIQLEFGSCADTACA